MSIEYDNPLVISPDPFLTNGQLRAEAVVVEGTMDLKAESATNLRDIAQLMTQQLAEMKLINLHCILTCICLLKSFCRLI